MSGIITTYVQVEELKPLEVFQRLLFSLPEHSGKYGFMIICLCLHLNLGTIDYKCNLDKDLFEYAKSTYSVPIKVCSTEFEEYAYCLMKEHSLQQPRKVLDAMDLLSLLVVDMENY